jgi:hypothetical protein
VGHVRFSSFNSYSKIRYGNQRNEVGFGFGQVGSDKLDFLKGKMGLDRIRVELIYIYIFLNFKLI